MKYMNNILDLHMNDRVEHFGLSVYVLLYKYRHIPVGGHQLQYYKLCLSLTSHLKHVDPRLLLPLKTSSEAFEDCKSRLHNIILDLQQ